MDSLNFAKNIPEWLNEDLFNTAIQRLDKNATIISFDIKAATAPGQNFASAVFRGKLKFQTKFPISEEKELSVIIKTQPVGVEIPGMDLGHLQDTRLFDTEMEMYSKTLPEIVDLLKYSGDNEIMCPNLIYQTLTPKPVIILEDVNTRGFDTMLKLPSDDFEISKIFARKLAKLHAAGFYLQEEHKSELSTYRHSIYEYEDIVKVMFNDSFDVVAKKLESWEDCEKFIEPLQNFKKDYLAKGKKSFTPNKGAFAFNVLNHGDFHGNNVLYKMKEDGSVEDVIFIDFQICVYASPAIDLAYAMYFFLSEENRKYRRDEFLSVYHQQFVKSLKSFGFLKPIPSLIDLQVESLKNGNLQVVAAVCIAPYMFFDMTKLEPEHLALGPAGFKEFLYSTPEIENFLKKEFERFLFSGFI